MELLDRTVIIVCAALIILLLLFLGHRIWTVVQQARLLFCVPGFVVLLHIAKADIEICLLGLYVGVLLVFGCFFTEKTDVRRRLCIVSMACVILTFIPCLTSEAYRKTHYKEEFFDGFSVMKEHYVLSRHKEIKWDELYHTYLVRFEEADAQKSKQLAWEAWNDFAAEFHDAHVQVVSMKEDEISREKHYKKRAGYDYGFSLVTMENGDTVFANVDENSDAYKNGVRDGMVVTALDGVPINRKKEESDIWFSVFPDKENEKFYQGLAATCLEEESISVEYIDDLKNEKQMTIMQQGNGKERFKETFRLLAGHHEKKNLTCEMLNEEIAYLVINDMKVSPSVCEENSFEEEEHYSGLKKRLKKELTKRKAAGAKHLVIDLRDNPGGYLEMSVAVASLFSKEESFAAAEGVYNEKTQGYEIIKSVNLEAEDVWGDGEIVILVNTQTTSAAELFVHFMSKKENVTVMGMTKSTGAAMGTSSYKMDTFELFFPMMLMLDENEQVLIDSDVSGINRAPLDVRIPLDETAFASIFGEKEDYVLKYAIEYLKD